MPDYYDPAARLSCDLAAALADKFALIKTPAVYFDGHYFILNKASAANASLNDFENAIEGFGFTSIDDKKEGFYYFCISNEWIGNAIDAFPEFVVANLDTAGNALATRMQAHIEFGLCGSWIAESYALALLLFKVIHTNSVRLRHQAGASFMKALEEHLRGAFFPAELTFAIKNTVHMLNTYDREFL